jgi:transposase
MRQSKAGLRLTGAGGLSDRQIAHSLSVSQPTVAEDVRRAQGAGVAWPLPATLDDPALERLLFPAAPAPPPGARLVPDWSAGHRELKRKGGTLFLLWQAYQATTPEGCPYRWFCQAYRAWAGTRALVMRQHHRAGAKLLVDDAGHSLPVVNSPSGEGQEAALVIAVLGASSYPSAEATWPQSLPDWLGAPGRALAAIGGVPEIVGPDNLKAAVPRAQRSAPALHRTYAELAQDYGVAVMPARAAKPRDQAKVAGGVQGVERWLLARLRPHTFCARVDGQTAIAARRPALNTRPCQPLPGSRPSLLAARARPALQP